MKKTKSLKAFTLVELIVVMVILAILVALMVPSLTKYIDKANDQSVLVEARYCLTALQTRASEIYAKDKSVDAALATKLTGTEADSVKELAEYPDTASISGVVCTGSRVTEFTYTNGSKSITWTKASGFGEVTTS